MNVIMGCYKNDALMHHFLKVDNGYYLSDLLQILHLFGL